MALSFKRALVGAFLLCYTTSFAQQKNFVLRTMDWGYRIVQGDSAKPKKKYLFVVPIVSYKPETRWQLGVSTSHFFRAKNNDSVTRPSLVRLNMSYTQNNQLSIRPMFEVFTADNKYSLRGLLQYSNFIENYWGIGNNTPESNKEVYSFNQYKANIKATRQLKKGIYLGLQLDYEKLYNLKHESGSLMALSNVTGVNGYYYFGLGPVFTFDNRNQIYFPTKGHIIDISASVKNKNVGSSSSFANITIDARQYVRLWNENVLAMQTFISFNDGDVPYRAMGTLGNESYFRGYYFGRYRDKHEVSLQAELRKQIWGPLSMVAFGGLGNVASSPEKLNKFIKPMYGIGLRIKAIPREKINFRLDYARGNNGLQAFYVTLNEAF
jgi:hypothetical protein